MKLRQTLFAALALFASTCFADISVGGLNYALSNDGTAKLTGASTLADTLRIPSTITSGGTTYSVTSVAQKAFKNKGTIKHIFIPASIERLENDAFSYMSDLMEVTIEDGYDELYVGFQDGTIFDDEMFYDCNKLESVYIGRNLTWDSGEEGPFQSRKALTKVTIGPLVTRLGCGYAEKKELFDDSNNIKQVIFMGRSTNEDKQTGNLFPLAILNSTGLDAAKIFNIDRELVGVSNTNIGELHDMFASATSITFGPEVRYLHNGMFQGCQSLTSITIPENITEVRDKAFMDCRGLKYIVLLGAPTIGRQAFAGCTALKRVCTNYDAPPTDHASATPDCFDAATYASARLQNLGSWKGAFEVLPWSEFAENYVPPTRLLSLDTTNAEAITPGRYDHISIDFPMPAETWTLMSLPMLVDSYYFGADAEVMLADTITVDSPFRSTLSLKPFDLDNNEFLPLDQPFFVRTRKAEHLIQCGTTDDTFAAEAVATTPSVAVPVVYPNSSEEADISEDQTFVNFCGTFTMTSDSKGREVNAFGAYLDPEADVHRIYVKADGMERPIYGLSPIEGDADDDGILTPDDVAHVLQHVLGMEASKPIFLDVLQLGTDGTSVNIRTLVDIIQKLNTK